MTSVRQLREFVTDRLTAAAEEIFREFEKTIAEYQDEIERQRRLLDVVWKPEVQLHRVVLPHQHVCKEDALTDQQLCDQERNFSLDQEEPSQIKKEEEEVCSSHEGEQLVLKQEIETCMVNPPNEGGEHQLLHDSSPVAGSQDQEGGKNIDSESTRNADAELKTRSCRNTSHSSSADSSFPPCQSKTGAGKKSLKRGSSLNIHLRVHTGEKQHVCRTCGKRFAWASMLNAHVRTHTGERPYLCVTCGKRFRERSKLKRHLFIHTGEKPYLCSTCGKRFNEQSKLNRHMAIHNNCRPYSCDTCGKRFKDTSTLNGHLKIHTDEKPFLCKTCGKRFNRTTHLRNHMKVHAR